MIQGEFSITKIDDEIFEVGPIEGTQKHGKYQYYIESEERFAGAYENDQKTGFWIEILHIQKKKNVIFCGQYTQGLKNGKWTIYYKQKIMYIFINIIYNQQTHLYLQNEILLCHIIISLVFEQNDSYKLIIMFESLLEKVLSTFLGQFIEGFDAQNLHVGIWSGEVTIQNVSLKADIIKLLELPIKICFSHIGKLKLNVPWKSLTSSPVEVTLSDLYIVLSAEHPDFWQFQDYSGFKKKIDILEKFKESIIANINDKQKSPTEDGYIKKLVLKILDNIQLSVSNIHIRFEDTIRNEFAWGFSIKNIETFTCNSEWKKQFFDRTKEENKKVPLQKLLILKNIGAYWNQQETEFLHSQPKEIILANMLALIISQDDPKEHPKYGQFILLLNAQGRLFQNTSGKFDSPEFALSIELNTIDLALENQQLQQIIKMAELFSLFQNRLLKHKKQKLLLSSQQIEDQKMLFLSMYEKILRSPDQSLKALTRDEGELFEQAVSNLDIDLLCEAAKEIIKVVQKEIAIKEAEEKKKKQGGWFSWGKKKDTDIIDQTEKDQLTQFIDQLADFQDLKDIKRPADYVWLSLVFALKSGSVHVLKQFESKREGVQLTYSGFSGKVEVKDCGMQVVLGLQSIGIDIVTEPILNGVVMYSESKRTPFLEPLNQQKFLDFKFETNPDHHKGVDKYIKLETGALKLIFNPIILVRIQQFTDFSVQDESLKNAAWDQVEIAQDMAANQISQSQLSPSILFIDVKIKSTIVVVPIPDTKENWLVNLGDVSIVTPRIDDVYYDHFEITLKDFTFKHYKSIEQCQQSITLGQHLENIDGSYPVIQNFKVAITAQILRGSSKPPIDKASVCVQGVLPQLDLFVNPLIYSRVLKIGDCFVEPQRDVEEAQKRQTRLSIEKAQTERTALMQAATKVGKIWKRGQLMTWSQYTAVLSGGYIYLFAKPKDQQPELFFWIRNSDFIDVNEQDAGMKNAFIIKNKYGENLIAMDKPKLVKEWQDAIEELRTQTKAEKKEHEEKQQIAVKESRPMNFGFEVKGFGLHIQDDKLVDWLNVGISGLNASATMLDGSIELDLKLRDLYVTDSVQVYLNPLLKYIVKSDPDPESNELIRIQVQQINNKDKRYNKTNLFIWVTFGTLQVIAKPLVVAKLLVFVTPVENQNVVPVQEEKDEEKKKRDQAKKDIENSTQQQQVKFDNMGDIILMDVNVKIRSIKAVLVHRFTTLPISEINIQNTEIGLIKYVDEMQLKGSLGNLQLLDLTNYPNTLNKESEYTLIQPKQMIGVKHQQQSLLNVNLKLFSDGSVKIVNNVAIVIDVEMSQLIIHVFMQPVLRLLDYTLQQLLFALSNPKQTIDPDHDVMVIQEEEIQEYHQQRSDKKKKSTILLTEEEQTFLNKQLTNPPAMKLNVKINNPQVILKPNQESDAAMVIDLGTILVANTRTKVKDRISNPDAQLDSVWVDTFIINMKDIQLYQENRIGRREFSLPFDFNVSVQIFGMAQQYQLQYPKLSFDEQLKITCFIAPMILQMTHSDYMFLMKCLFHNIAFDDGFDNMIRNSNPKYFKVFFEQQRSQEIRLREMMLAQNDQPALSFQLDMENLTIFLLKDIQPKPTPFLRMMLVMMRVTFQKCNNGSAKVGLLIRDMEGTMFQSDVLGQFNELPFIGSMNVNQSYSYEQVTNLTGLVRGRQGALSNAGTAVNLASCGQLSLGEARQKIFRFEDTNQPLDMNQYKLIFQLSMKLTGDKDMKVELADFKLQLHAGPLFEVLALIAMDDPNLTPPPGKYVQQAILEQQQAPQQQGSLVIKIQLKNVITCVPSQVEQNVLAIRGIFDIDFVMAPQKTVQEVARYVKENNIPEKEFSKLNETMKIGARLQRLEIFLCKTYDLGKKDDFKQVKKREILNPFDLDVQFVKSSVLQKNYIAFTDVTTIGAKISPIYLKVSFKDLLTIQTGLNYQLSQMPKQPQVQVKDTNEISKLDASHLNNLQLAAMRVDAEIENIKVIVLNDMGNSFTPLFDYEMDSVKLFFDQNNIFIKIEVTLPFQLSNYNPMSSKWEPIIERAGFMIEIFQSQIKGLGGSTQNLITVEQMADFQEFNVTLSTVCVQTILRALAIMNRIFKKKEDDDHHSLSKSITQELEQSVSDESINSVSPYAIRNLIGQQIAVEYIDNPRIPSAQVPINHQQNLVMEEEQEILNSGKLKRVHVHIKNEGKPFTLKFIDLDRNRSRLYTQDHLQAFCTVKLDQVTNQKILIVQSPIIFVNKTSKNLVLQLSDNKNQQTIRLTHGKSDQEVSHIAPIPLGYINAKVSLRLSDCPQYTEDISVDKLIQQQDITHEIQTRDGSYLLLKIYKDKEFAEKYKIEIQTPFRFNNSLPKDIYLQVLNHNKETTYTKKVASGQTIEDYSHCHSKNTYIRVLLQGFYWSDEYRLFSGEEEQKDQKNCIGQLPIFDGFNNQTKLLVFEPWRQIDYDKATREFVIHASGYIINRTGMPLTFFTSEKKKDAQLLGGQDSINSGDTIDKNTIFIGPDSGDILQLSHSSLPSKTSQFPIQISTLGEPQIDVVKTCDDNLADLVQVFLGAKLDLSICNHKYTLFNKTVTLEPRFILVNNCSQEIVISNIDDSYSQTLEKGTRTIYQCKYDPKNKDRDAQQFITMRVQSPDYQKSGKINISAVGIIYYQIKNLRKDSECLFFSCDARQEGGSLYIIFSQLPQDKAPYKIEITAPNLQLDVQELNIRLNSENPIAYYAWDDPLQSEKVFNVELSVRDDPYDEFKPFKYRLYPDYIGLFKVYPFRPTKGSKTPPIQVALTILPEGSQKKILIALATKEQLALYKQKPKQDFLKQIKEKNNLAIEEDEETDRQSQSLSISRQSTLNDGDKIENQINLKLVAFSLSMIHNSDVNKRPSEFFHFTFKNLEFVTITTDLSQVVQLRIQYINFDHNAQFFVNFPVVLTPQKYALYNPVQKQEKNKNEAQQQQQSTKPQQVQSDKYFFNVLIMKDNKVADITLLQNVTLELDPFEIKIEQLFINSLLEYVWAITSFQGQIAEFEKSQSGSVIGFKQQQQPEEEEKQMNEAPLKRMSSIVQINEEWVTKKLPEPSLPTYISEIIISPISINLTFQMSGKGDLNIGNSAQSAIFTSIAQALGVALTDIDNAPIFFQGFKLENCFDTVGGISGKMFQNYKSEGIKQIGKLVGSLSIIGNPIGLFNNVSTGFKDFIDKPAAGLTQGPLEAGLGLAQGATSLVSHTVAGAFNSVNKITGSVGSGLANLTMDEEYLRKREKMKMQKPKHIGQGIGQGAKSIMTGLTDGITGVFLKPFKGAKEGGVGGFFKGTAQGLAGLVIKPVTGVLDGLSQTAAGIQNTVTYFDDKANTNRARNIRPVYGYEGYATEFNPVDAEGFAMIHFIKNGLLMNDRFVSAYFIIPDVKEPDNKFMLVLTIENFVYMSFKTKKKVWILSTNDIVHIDLVPSGIKIQVNKPQKQLKNKYITQVIVPDDTKDELFKKMSNLLESIKIISN